jgi:hypothetical protein
MTTYCAYADHRVPDEEILHVKRFSGGSYNRSGRWMPANICRECATRLVATATSGLDQHERYGVNTLRLHLHLPRVSIYKDPEPHSFVRFEIESYGQPTVCVSCGRHEAHVVHRGGAH